MTGRKSFNATTRNLRCDGTGITRKRTASFDPLDLFPQLPVILRSDGTDINREGIALFDPQPVVKSSRRGASLTFREMPDGDADKLLMLLLLEIPESLA